MFTRPETDRFLIRSRDFEPAYMALHRTGELRRRAEAALERLSHCLVCPRNCGVDRMANKTAACKTGRYARVASYFAHFGEEDCLRGRNGSGTIFFSWCNLRCVFCFHPDTLITTDQGLIRIADIFHQGQNERELQGGFVRFVDGQIHAVARNGKLAPVAKAFRHHFSGDLVMLEPYSCPPLLLTPNHQVFAIHKSEPTQVASVRADQLTKDHYLVVPRRQPAGMQIQLNICELLSFEEGRSRKTPMRVPADDLASLFTQEQPSYDLAATTGYDPAYIRKLRGLWRKNQRPEKGDPEAVNEIIAEEGLVRFTTERRPGIPAQMKLDEQFAWLLGIYCAEGYVLSPKERPNSHRLIFSFARHETQFVERTQQLLRELFGVPSEIAQRRATITVEVGKASLALLFVQLCGTGAQQKQVPSVLRQATPEVIRAFLQGVAAGDGYDSGTHLVVNTVSEKFALGLFEIGLLLGAIPSFHRWHPARTKKIEGREVGQSPLYSVTFPKVNPATGALRSKWVRTPEYYRIPVHKIDRVPYDGPVYNLEMDDPDHSYLAPFVAVSNCQNFDVSQAGEGEETRPERLAEMMLELQARGCHNINFVTPEHVVPQVLEALPIAVERGLRLPIVYNTSAYDSLDSLQLLDGIVDIYMPDFKCWDSALSLRYLRAKDYAEAARRVIKEMHRQVGNLTFDEHGLAKRGLLVRHLVMPGQIAGTTEIMRFLAEEVSPDTYVNVMDQYYPAGKVNAEKFPEINRHTTKDEYSQAVQIAREAGLRRLDERRRIRLWR